MNSVKQKVMFFVVDPVGKTGGMVVLWKYELQVKKSSFH